MVIFFLDPPPSETPPSNPSWNTTPPPQPASDITNILASLEQWDIQLTDEQLKKIPDARKNSPSGTERSNDSNSPIFNM